MRYGKESDPFLHSKAWRRVRQKRLDMDNGMCCDCMERFRAGLIEKPNRATMVHHVIPREERPDLALVLSNLRSLCDGCHNKRHPEKGGRTPGKPKDRPGKGMRIIKV